VGPTLGTQAHVRLFSPWKYNVCDTTVTLLEHAGLYSSSQSPSTVPEECPTGGEYCEHYLAHMETWLKSQPNATVLLNTRVDTVARDGCASHSPWRAPFLRRDTFASTPR
jgi:hypothetical protein